jgi:hypothetical protein
MQPNLVGGVAASRLSEGGKALQVLGEKRMEIELSVLVSARNVVFVQGIDLASAGIHDMQLIAIDLGELLEHGSLDHGIEEGLVSTLHDLDLLEVALLGVLSLVRKQLAHVLGELVTHGLLLLVKELLLLVLCKLLSVGDLHVGLAGSRVGGGALLVPGRVVLPVVVNHMDRVEVMSFGPDTVMVGKLLQSCEREPALNNLHHAYSAVLAGGSPSRSNEHDSADDSEDSHSLFVEPSNPRRSGTSDGSVHDSLPGKGRRERTNQRIKAKPGLWAHINKDANDMPCLALAE